MEFQPEIYLDDYMIHKVQKTNSLSDLYPGFLMEECNPDLKKKYEPKYRYNLFSVVCHVGEIHVGHYLTYTRFQYHDFFNWIMFDGENSCPVDESTVLESIPY